MILEWIFYRGGEIMPKSNAAIAAITANENTKSENEKKLVEDKIVKVFGGTTVDCSEAVSEYVSGSDWRIKANANVGYSNAGLVNNIAGKIIANYWLDEVYSPEAGNAHRNADMYIHDLDCLTGYCAGWSLRQVLDEGFNGVEGKVASKPPKHFREALGQMANFLCVLQQEWAGAQAFSSFDTYLAPYVFADQLEYKDVKKAVIQFVYNLNVTSRWGQSPFTNITLDIKAPDDLKDQSPTKLGDHIFAGLENEELLAKAQKRDMGIRELTDLKYGHFEKEMEMITMAYYEVMTEGDASGQPFTFPIPTVNITEDFEWNTPVANAIFENTAKVGSSYFQNFTGSQWTKDPETGEKVRNPDAYSPGAVRSMCCRLQLDLRELLKRGGGLFGSAEMTGSIGVVTINMARLGYRFKGDMPGLMAELDRLMALAKGSLEKKRTFIQSMYNRGLYPYSARYLKSFRNHFSTIGVNGINELIRNFTNDELNIADTTGVKMALEIIEHMRDTMKEFQQETGNLYNLEATPAEGTTYRLAKKDKELYPKILQAGTEENNYYTNSSQLPSGHTDDPFEALELQNEIQCKYTGGTVLHMYMNEQLSSPEACKKFVKKVLENYQMPYITITPTFSICKEHGYLNGEQPECPTCGEETKVWTRVMGYFRPVDSFNIGKKGEHEERVHFLERRVECEDLFHQATNI